MREVLKQLVQILMDEEYPVPITEIAEKMGFTVRYVRKILEENKEECRENGFQIEAVFRRGCQLKVLDQDLFYRSIDSSEDTYELPKEVIRFLLEQKDFISTDNLADRFYISRSTMDRVMRECRPILQKFELEIVTRQKYGIYVKGAEWNKRACLAYCLNEEVQNTDSIIEIQNLLFEILRKYNYEIYDVSFNNLVYHIAILLRRLRDGDVIQDEITLADDFVLQKQIADEIVTQLQEMYHLNIPESEKGYLILHLLGKQVLNDSNAIDFKVHQLVDTVLKRILDLTGYDFTDNWELYMGLCLHIQPMLYRTKYHFVQENPLYYQIKREMIGAYNLAVITQKVILEETGLDIGDQEVSFLAVHFSGAMGKEKRSESNVKVIVVCGTGIGTSRLLKHKLITQFQLKDENITLSSLIQLPSLNWMEYACVVSTIEIPFAVPIPVIHFSLIMNDDRAAEIQNILKQKSGPNRSGQNSLYDRCSIYSNLDLKKKDDILHFIARKASSCFESEDGLYRALIQREKLSSTEVGNKCCMPHPFNLFPSESTVIIGILKKPVRWQRDKIQVFVFASFAREDKQHEKILDGISNMVSDSLKIQKLIASPDRNTLLECMEN